MRVNTLLEVIEQRQARRTAIDEAVTLERQCLKRGEERFRDRVVVRTARAARWGHRNCLLTATCVR